MAMNNTPKIAIVLPVYNTSKYLAECLDSFLIQTYKNFTIFAVNDGSTDGSREILEEYLKKDARIVLLNKKNGGVSSARNVALNKISECHDCDLICFADSDDFVTPSYLASYVKASIRYEADYIVCGWRRFDKNGVLNRVDNLLSNSIEMDKREAFKHLFGDGKWDKECSVTKSHFLANRCFSWSVIKDERFDENLRKGEDLDFLIRALLNISKGVCMTEINYMYRLRLSSLSSCSSTLFDYVDLYLSLMKKGYPEFINLGLEKSAIAEWWKCVKISVESNEYKKNSRKLLEAYRDFNHDKASRKNKKRFFIFSLGWAFLKLYFRLQKNKASNNFESGYE